RSPSTTPQVNVTVTPATISAEGTQRSPTQSTSITMVVSTISALGGIYDPTTSTEINVTVQLPAISGLGTIRAPALVYTGGVLTMFPSALQGEGTIRAPTIAGAGLGTSRRRKYIKRVIGAGRWR
ncbi:MAG: hypothetical protein ACXABY_14250, partial [Candidatus Thorarchaeota archaeon]